MRINFAISSLKLTGLRCPIYATTSHFHIQAHNSTKLLAASQIYDVKSVRYIRSRVNNESGEHHKNNEDGQENKEKETGKEGEPKKVDPELIRKLRMYVLAVAGLSFVSSFFLLSQMFTGDRNIVEGVNNEDFTRPGIPFKKFIDSYLKHGEVKRIVFLPANQRAVAILHQGAFIDGKPSGEQSVVIEYQQNAQQFWADIRKSEGELGIGLSQGVQIDLYQGMTTFKVIELIIGVVILAWLGTQYGRLLRQRLLQNKQQNQKK
ncbi:unnamed protein product [Caenorhabditis angaria]|uniref:Uncharacterized protein n=1 Tax=Caenorhabditis angaria TaxID=860376 RepID=A0A9P1MV32_9PELO|nr:unnamed protein product [Caenorhabditis angaria]